MNHETVERAVIAVLGTIQEDRGHPATAMGSSTCPLEDLPDFDTRVAPAATSDLATKLGISIPNNQNIFVDPTGRRRLTVGEIVARVLDVAEPAA